MPISDEIAATLVELGLFQRWFHPNITGSEAVRLLLENGQDWSFLARPSSTEGTYTLSVRHNDQVIHIKIQNNGDSYNLCGKENFATVPELVQHYMENQEILEEKNGTPVKLRYPLACNSPIQERWFHGSLTGKDAENLLLEKGKVSSFLVRESGSQSGDFVISVRCEHKITHVKIYCQGDKYDVGGSRKFDSLSELVEFYKQSPIVDASGAFVYIKYPLNNCRMLASNLKNRISQLQAADDSIQKTGSGNSDGFLAEFSQLQQAEFVDECFSRHIGSKPGNKAKNRYKNILPYDYTRVVLTDGSEEHDTDYINANYVDWKDDDQVMETNRRYIATQGPLVSTMVDFYRMIWQEGSHIIINLARITERGKVQIHIYWPTQEDNFEKLFVFEHPTEDGGKNFVCQYRVKLLSEKNDEVCVCRVMLLTKEDKNGQPMEAPRKITQFHYMIWPDYNVPEDCVTMVDFIENINDLVESLPSPGPLVIHCSAGIGRSGTLIVIDMIISLIKMYGYDCDIDIFNTVLMVRGQRSGVVQG